MKMRWQGLAFILFCGVGVSSCAGPRPVEDLVIAKAALDAAQEAGATSMAPGFWHQAEESYRKGLKSMQGNYNYEARTHFQKAKVFAEKAENSTRLKRFKSGEGYP